MIGREMFAARGTALFRSAAIPSRAEVSALKNARHERFAQEIAAGKGLEEAHGLAGYRADRRNAQHLRQRDDISRRIEEILANREKVAAKVAERAIERAAITKADVIGMLVEDRQLARANTQASAAIRAAELIGKELGMFIDRREQGKPGDFADLPDEELDRRLVALMMERGMTERQARALVREHAGPDRPLGRMLD